MIYFKVFKNRQYVTLKLLSDYLIFKYSDNLSQSIWEYFENTIIVKHLNTH